MIPTTGLPFLRMTASSPVGLPFCLVAATAPAAGDVTDAEVTKISGGASLKFECWAL